MAGATGGALAANVTAAGGFGFIGAGLTTSDDLLQQILLARSILKLEPGARLPIGMGFIGWTLDSDPKGEELVTLAVEQQVKAIWFSFGENIGKWIDLVRNLDEQKGNENKNKTLIFVLVNSVAEAIQAVDEWKVDAIVAQGIEAGGHGSASAPPLITLLPDILRALPSPSLPVIGAGGLTHGFHLAALLALGASGIVIGTRFLATPECLWSESQKSILLAAPSSGSTARSMAWDYARGTTGWPKGVDGRGLKNKIWVEHEAGVSPEELKSRYGTSTGDPHTTIVWAGTGVGAVNQIMNSKDIVKEVALEAATKLQAIAGLVSV